MKEAPMKGHSSRPIGFRAGLLWASLALLPPGTVAFCRSLFGERQRIGRQMRSRDQL